MHGVGTVHDLGLAVTVTVGEDAARPVLLVDPPDLVGDDVGRLVPTDAHVLALAPILRIPFPLGIPVHSLEGIFDPVRRVDPLLIGKLIRRYQPFERRCVDLAVLAHTPRPDLFFGVSLLVVLWSDAKDLAVLHIDRSHLRMLPKRALGEGLHHGPFRRWSALPCFYIRQLSTLLCRPTYRRRSSMGSIPRASAGPSETRRNQ